MDKHPSRQEKMSLLDFYTDAMSFINKLTATLTCFYTELHEALKPHDNMMSTVLETQML